AGGVTAQWIVDAEVELLRHQRLGTALRTPSSEVSCARVPDLRGEELHLEGDDRLALRVVDRQRRLRVTLGRGVGLVGEVEVKRGKAGGRAGVAKGLPSVPHHGAQEPQICGRKRPA